MLKLLVELRRKTKEFIAIKIGDHSPRLQNKFYHIAFYSS